MVKCGIVAVVVGVLAICLWGGHIYADQPSYSPAPLKWEYGELNVGYYEHLSPKTRFASWVTAEGRTEVYGFIFDLYHKLGGQQQKFPGLDESRMELFDLLGVKGWECMSINTNEDEQSERYMFKRLTVPAR